MKPVKIFKIAGIILLSVVILISLSAGLFIYFFPKDRVRTIVIDQAQSVLKRKVTLESIYYSPRGVILRNVAIHDTMDQSSTVLVSVEWVNVGFAIRPLLRKELDVKKLSFYRLNATITFDEKGISNFERLINSISSTPGTVSAKIKSIRIWNSTINLVKPPDFLKPLEGTYTIDTTITFPEQSKLMVDNCSIILPGTRGTIRPELLISTSPEFRLQGDVDIDKLSLAWVYQWHGDQYPQPYDIVTGKVRELLITPHLIEGFAKASSTLHKSPRMVFADGFCRVDLDKRTINITGTQARINTSTVLLNRLFLSMNGDLLALEATNAKASIGDIRELVPVIPSGLFGYVSGSLSYNGRISCNLNLKECGYDATNRVLSDINVPVTIENNIFKAEKIPVRVFGHDCIISAASTDGAFKRLFINLAGDTLDLAKIQKGSGGREKGLNLPIEISGTISAGRVKIQDIVIDNLNLNYTIAGQNVALNRFSCQYLGSDLKGKGDINLSTTPPRVNAQIAFSRLKIQSLGIVIQKFNNRLFGLASGNVNLSLDLNEQILESIRGTVDFSIENGKVVNTGIQNGLGLLLSELRYKLRDLEFKTIYGNAEISGNLFRINSFIFKSENVRLKLDGSLSRDMVTPGMNLSLEFRDYFIQDIPRPAVMGLKKYQTGQWYIIPFSVKGDITDSKNIQQAR